MHVPTLLHRENHDMDSKNRWIVALGALGLLVGFSGLALVAVPAAELRGKASGVAAPESLRAPSSGVASEETLAALVSELAALREELAELRLAGRQGGASVERQALPREDLATTTLSGAKETVAAAETTTPRPPPARTSRNDEALVRLGATDENAVSQDHAFWTYQQVLDAYGPPDQMHPSQEGGLTWLYHLSEGRDAGFVFFDGFVVRVWG